MLSKQELLDKRRELIINRTLSERELERHLSKKHWRCKLQKRIGFYIVDFVFTHRMLIIELDGASHDTTKDYDRRRDTWLESLGFTVKRFPNEVVWENPELVILTIESYPNQNKKIYTKAMRKAGAIYSRVAR